MAGKENLWVVHRSDGTWALKREGSPRALHVTSTQGEALQVGIPLAKRDGVELIIQGRDNTINRRNSYGSDPYPPKG